MGGEEGRTYTVHYHIVRGERCVEKIILEQGLDALGRVLLLSGSTKGFRYQI